MGKFNPDAYLSDFDADAYLAEPEPMPEGSTLDAFVEPAKAVAGNIATGVFAGYGGMAQAINPFAEEGAGAQAVEDIRAEAPDFSPQTQSGQKGMETLGSFVDAGIDIVNFPISGLEGLATLIKGFTLDDPLGGLDKAVSTIKNIQDVGISKHLGEKTFEATGSPLLATAAELSPDVLLGGAALPGMAAITETAESIGRGLQAGAKPVLTTGKEIIEGAKGYQPKGRAEMVDPLRLGSNDPALAKYELVEGTKLKSDTDLPTQMPTGVERFFDTKGPKVKVDPLSSAVLKQGFRPGVIQPMKNASKPDKALMFEMTEIGEKAKKDELFGMENRPGDVAGDLLMGKLDVIRRANKRSGKAIKPITDSMKGKMVDVMEVGEKLSDALDDMGVTLTRGESGKLTADYLGSNIEGATALTGRLDNILQRVDRVAGSGEIDAFALHQLKQFIDDQVTFGKNSEGLSGQTERVLKKLRADINDTLGANFPEYAEANKTYSGTIKALDAFQKVAGRQMDLLGDNADKATGTLMRRLMSNAQSRITLLDSLKGIDAAVDQFSAYGGPLRIEGKGGVKNDLKMLVLYADELDRILGAAPRASLQGQFDQAFGTAARAATSKSGLFEASVDFAGKQFEKAQGINEDNAIKSIKELLRKTNE